MTRRTRLELDDPFGRVNVDDSAAALPHTPHSTWSRVGSRGLISSKVNTPLRIVLYIQVGFYWVRPCYYLLNLAKYN